MKSKTYGKDVQGLVLRILIKTSNGIILAKQKA